MPRNSALVVIDYQPSQFAGVRSIDRDLLLENIASTVKTAKAFDIPIVHSTINVGIERVVQAGAHPVTWVALAVELQRDSGREETVADVSRSCSPNDC